MPVYLMTNLSNMFLVQCWRLETSSRSFYSLNEMTVWQDLSIFSIWYYPVLIFFYLNFQKIKTLETWNNCLLSNWNKLLHWTGPRAQPYTSNTFKKSKKNIVHAYISQLARFVGLMVNGLWFKRYIQKHLLSHVLMVIMTSQI